MSDRRQESMSSLFSKYWGAVALFLLVVFYSGSIWSDNNSLKANEENRKKEVQSYIETLDKVKDAIVAINLSNAEKDNNISVLISQVTVIASETRSLRQEMNAVHLKLAEHAYMLDNSSGSDDGRLN